MPYEPRPPYHQEEEPKEQENTPSPPSFEPYYSTSSSPPPSSMREPSLLYIQDQVTQILIGYGIMLVGSLIPILQIGSIVGQIVAMVGMYRMGKIHPRFRQAFRWTLASLISATVLSIVYFLFMVQKFVASHPDLPAFRFFSGIAIIILIGSIMLVLGLFSQARGLDELSDQYGESHTFFSGFMPSFTLLVASYVMVFISLFSSVSVMDAALALLLEDNNNMQAYHMLVQQGGFQTIHKILYVAGQGLFLYALVKLQQSLKNRLMFPKH